MVISKWKYASCPGGDKMLVETGRAPSLRREPLPSAPASLLTVIARNEAIQAQADTLHVYAHAFANTTPCHCITVETRCIASLQHATYNVHAIRAGRNRTISVRILSRQGQYVGRKMDRNPFSACRQVRNVTITTFRT
ncbi:MAG: hypothetical protein LBJ47_10750 [Tannerella sp.]|nr:hypothetical protein [Tannerella sp.]